MGVNDSLPLNFEELGGENFCGKKKLNKDKVIQILWKLKFVDKRIFIGFGLIFAVVMVFSLIVFSPIRDDSFNSNEKEFFDPFVKNNLGDSPLVKNFKDTNSIDEKNKLISENIVGLDEGVNFVSSLELLNGVRARLSTGDKLELDMDTVSHEIIIDSVNGKSIEITIRSDPIFATLRLGIPKKFDLDKDGFYDLSVELLEIVDNEGILIMQKIKESYDITSMDIVTDLIETSEGFFFITIEDIPYSCKIKDKYIDYSYIRISRKEERIFDEKRFSKIIYDTCTSDKSFIKYSCDVDNSLLSVSGDCGSRLETCFEGECIISSYEKDIGIIGSPEKSYVGVNECHLLLGDTTFWFSSEEKTCQDLFIASNFLPKDIFIELLGYYGLDSSILAPKLIKPQSIKIVYSHSLENIYLFEDIESKFISNKCEFLNYFGLDLYCFNSVVNKKNNNLKYIINQITLLKDMNSSYSSTLSGISPYSFFKSNRVTYVDGKDSSIYDGIFTSIDTGCVSGDKKVNYKKVEGTNSLFLCDGLFDLSMLYSNKVSYSAMLFKEALKLLNNLNDKCYESTRIEAYIEDLNCVYCYDYGDYDKTTDNGKMCIAIDEYDNETMCKEYEKLEVCKDICGVGFGKADWRNEIRNIPRTRTIPVFYNNFDSLYGGYVDYLYGMSKDLGLSCSNRQLFYSMASTEFNNFACLDGATPGYIPITYPSC